MIRSQQAIAKNATTPTAGRMGPLELAVYKSDWKSSQVYRRHVEDVAARRELEAAAQAAQDQILKAAAPPTAPKVQVPANRRAVASRHSAIPSPTVTGMSRRRNAMSRRRHPAASPPDCCWRGYSTTIPP